MKLKNYDPQGIMDTRFCFKLLFFVFSFVFMEVGNDWLKSRLYHKFFYLTKNNQTILSGSNLQVQTWINIQVSTDNPTF